MSFLTAVLRLSWQKQHNFICNKTSDQIVCMCPHRVGVVAHRADTTDGIVLSCQLQQDKGTRFQQCFRFAFESGRISFAKTGSGFQCFQIDDNDLTEPIAIETAM